MSRLISKGFLAGVEERFVQRVYTHLVLKIAPAFFRSPHNWHPDAEDIAAQEAVLVLNVLRLSHKLPPNGEFQAAFDECERFFRHRLRRRAARDCPRARKRPGYLEDLPDQGGLIADKRGEDFVETLQNLDTLRAVWKVLEEWLPSQEVPLFFAYVLGALGDIEYARQVEKTRLAVRKSVQRLREKLRERLGHLVEAAFSFFVSRKAVARA
jgi:DNA-directed RNA polymerase specialized sigma24 family protein